MVDEKVALYISKSLYNEVEDSLKEKGGELTSVEDYVEFVLREFLMKRDGEKAHTKEDEELIKKRLRRLGYL
ncbi:MAG: CopG family transcriptional regulator [Candidatus Bathyarchaeota archaeon]|nr:CopG family transcriptional regulator [Candidatus Bathyarchaeota archaeon]